MKQILTILILSIALGYFLPWWVIVPVAFGAGFYFEEKPGKSFVISFTTIFIYWALFAFYIDMKNDSLLSNRMANMIIGSNGSILMILISALIGGLVAGMSGLTGSLLKKAREQVT